MTCEPPTVVYRTTSLSRPKITTLPKGRRGGVGGPKHQTYFIVKAALSFILCSECIVFFSSNDAWINSKFSACRMR